MLLLIIFKKSRPKLLLRFLFPQNKVDATGRDMVLRLRNVDLSEKLQFNGERTSLGDARERKFRGLQVELDGFR